VASSDVHQDTLPDLRRDLYPAKRSFVKEHLPNRVRYGAVCTAPLVVCWGRGLAGGSKRRTLRMTEEYLALILAELLRAARDDEYEGLGQVQVCQVAEVDRHPHAVGLVVCFPDGSRYQIRIRQTPAGGPTPCPCPDEPTQ
jgi:hypothetical protein